MANKEEQIGAGQVIHAETFRDSVATIEQTGSRKWVYPKKPKGKFTNYRDIVTFILLAIFFITPFLKINGNAMLKINIIDREFFIFGQPIHPQKILPKITVKRIMKTREVIAPNARIKKSCG